MRLTAIKLAGFKSFVDPTTFRAPTNLTGIVGPNGCGKSNIIDAVRWVMGEISAKHLRGDTMADVVFTGSNTRKPVGQASVELVFDNSDGRLGGRFAAYSEISVRRQVGRDAQSSYFINGARCRRRDVMDVFTPGDHGSTFGVNPLAAAVGLEALNILIEDKLAERSMELGEYMIKGLGKIDSPLIKDIRGRGLFVGVEIDPALGSAREICEALMERGLLSKETHETVVRLAPPLVINREQIDWAIEQIDTVLGEMDRVRLAS